jgi:GT2 family glycosyltransferase
MMPEITALIPNYNGGERLLRVLADLARQSLRASRVLVIDNGSTDASDAEAERAGAGLLRLGENTGFARAVNAGLRASLTPLVAVLNNDIEMAEDYLERLAQATQSGARFATGKILQKRQPGRMDGSFDLPCLGRTAWRCGWGDLESHLWNRGRNIHSPPWTAVLFRREVFDRVGLLDERFESYLEDIDFGIRCALAGVVGQYVPEAVACHWGSATLGAWHPDTVQRISRNQVYLARKYPPDGWRARWCVVLAQLMWGGVALRHGQLGSWLRGKREGLQTAGVARESASADQVLESAEQLMRELQRAGGSDWYWKLYFALH